MTDQSPPNLQAIRERAARHNGFVIPEGVETLADIERVKGSREMIDHPESARSNTKAHTP